ncbi:MAG TPA: ABC transporter permease [Streptosporangiaceae bacterium]|jgi:peptide/nickel transport system permease protein|nr:ABC transporter permease [Streptosporangiaceae bacterium]
MAVREPGAGALAVPGPDEPAGSPAPEVAAARGSWRLMLATFAENPLALAGVGLVVLIVAFCFIGPLLYKTNQVTVNLNINNIRPGGKYPLGTDNDGFNVLGRLMVGGQSSLELGFAVSIATSVIGTLYGAIAGLAGGLVDAVMMRIVDTFLALPTLVLLLILVNVFPPSLWVIILLITALSWLSVARLVRGEVLTLREREYVQAVRAMGGSSWRIVTRHLIPNSVGVIIVNATFTIADAILYLSALSFLGLGPPPPEVDWGGMLSNGLDFLFDGYWWLVYPAAIILILTVVAFNLIGDAIRDSLDVRLQRR